MSGRQSTREIRHLRYSVYFSEVEWSRLETLSREFVRPPATLLRERSLGRVRHPTVGPLLAALGRVGNNTNQICRKLSHTAPLTFQEAAYDLADQLRHLIRRLSQGIEARAADLAQSANAPAQLPAPRSCTGLRTRRVTVRYSASESAALRARCRELGQRTGTYIREQGLRRFRHPPMAHLVEAADSIGHDVNQVARRLNAGSPVTRSEVRAALDQVGDLIDHLVGALPISHPADRPDAPAGVTLGAPAPGGELLEAGVHPLGQSPTPPA